jgi:predicted AAA+ superfamily ATPase
MREYMSRIADKVLVDALRSSGAVLIEGPKWCGKTWTAQQKAASVLYMQDPDNSAAYLETASIKPSLLLDGTVPRLLDEWQMAPVLWDAVRHAVDQRGDVGQFILTGSAVPADDAILHSGTGRIVRRKMRPMSLFESLESSGTVSLMDLFAGAQNIAVKSKLSLESLVFALARGGWPASIGKPEQVALAQVYDYVDAVINTDISRVDGVEKNPARVRSLLRSYARNIATPASMITLRDDIAADDTSVSEKTIAAYLTALTRIHVVEELPAWSPALRSKTAIRSAVTRHFVDPSIAVAALRTSPAGLLGDFETLGLLFESLCVRDLRIYASAHDGELFHYRDKSGLEADAVVNLKDGRWGAVEVKMGVKEIDDAARHLISLAQKIDEDKMMKPSFLMVLTATEFGYRRDDGVLVVPIGCLKD